MWTECYLLIKVEKAQYSLPALYSALLWQKEATHKSPNLSSLDWT